MAENWELVRVHCVVCHSPQQFLRQRGTEATWTGVIRWMQKSGGLWKLDEDTEKKIISYLAANYQPDPTKYRRAPIPATLMPENPYESETRREVEEKKKAGLIPKGTAEALNRGPEDGPAANGSIHSPGSCREPVCFRSVIEPGPDAKAPLVRPVLADTDQAIHVEPEGRRKHFPQLHLRRRGNGTVALPVKGKGTMASSLTQKSLGFMSSDRTQNAERRTQNAERRTQNAERRTQNFVRN